MHKAAWACVRAARSSRWRAEGGAGVQLAANLSYLFTELPMMERFAAAREAGFTGIEIPFPYDLSARALHRAAEAEGLAFTAMACPPPNWAGGARGFAAEAGREARFRSDFVRALRFAEVLKARHIRIMAGTAEGAEAQARLLDNLSWACQRAPHASLLLEPTSHQAQPGAFLCDLDQAAAVVGEVGGPNLGLLFDVWHIQALTGDVLAAWDRVAPLVRHVQISGYPERAEPLAGVIDFPALFARMRATRFGGWVVAEYAPARGTQAGLGWMAVARGLIGT